MCGIFGFVGLRLSSEEANSLLAAMAARLRHRGPDAEALYRDGEVALGACRLSITDPPGGDQPFRTPGDGLVCVFNGEIYNHRRLRRRLLDAGEPLRTACDGEVLPYLAARHGDAAFELLDGMYAVALWDRGRRALTLAVDPQGEKPLYLARHRGGWLFASELKALLAWDGLSAEVDPAAIRRYLIDRAIFHPRTGLRGIRKLMPGERVVLGPGTSERGRRAPFAVPGERRDGAAGLRRAIRRAVLDTARCELPVGVLLSGGLDSSLVLALAAGRPGPKVEAFCVGYRGTPEGCDERRHADAAARHAGIRLHRLEIGPEQVPELLRRVVWHLDEPNQDPVTVPTYAVMGEARRRVRVVLTGDGADELFGGYARFGELTPGGGGAAGYLAGLHLCPPAQVDRLLTPEFAGRLEGDDPLDRPLEPAAGEPALLAAVRFERRHRLPGYHLSRLDRLSMAWGLEARAPFLRRELRERAESLAPAELIDGGREKVLLRAAAEGVVGAGTLARRKQPFTFPVPLWLPGPLHDAVRDRLLDPGAWIAAVVRRDAVAGALDRLRAGDPRAAGWVWGLLVLEEWNEAFLVRRGAPPATVPADAAVASAGLG